MSPTQGNKLLYDGLVSAEGGIDSGKSPTIATTLNPNGLRRNQLAFAQNTTMRGGRLKPRPGWKKLELDEYDNQSGRFQGAAIYNPDNDLPCIVAAIDGRFFRYNIGSSSFSDITPAAGPNPNNRPQVWFYQAENFLIGQDGQSPPFIYDGGASRRAANDEVPAGTVGVYNNGRIWQALPNGVSFVAGDLVYSDGNRAAVLKFTENTFLNEGGAFTVPANSGKITAMCGIGNIDTSLGQGPLLVFTGNTVFSVNAPFDRDEWKNVTYPIQSVSLITYGAQGQYSTVLQNGDAFFRSLDGVRSFIVARRNFGEWGNTPLSREMNRTIAYDDPHLLWASSAVIFDNRLLTTCSPVNSRHGVWHRGLMSLDFDLVSGMTYKQSPAWEGIWTGPNILQILVGRFNGVERCFAFALSEDNIIELWELTTDAKFDSVPATTRINWKPEFGSYSFERPFALKRLQTGDIWIDNLVGEVDFSLQFRPDQYPCWLDWESWEECAEYQDCDVEECDTPTVFKPQYRPRKRFIQPPESCDTIVDRPHRDAYEFQPRLSITGYCEIKQFRIAATERTEPIVGGCSE